MEAVVSSSSSETGAADDGKECTVSALFLLEAFGETSNDLVLLLVHQDELFDGLIFLYRRVFQIVQSIDELVG